MRRIELDAEPTIVAPTAPERRRTAATARSASPRRAGAARATAGHERMRAEALTVAYGGKLAVKEVTLPIRQGEVLALIGPSGCGKTTLLRSLNRLTELTPDRDRSGRDHARRRGHRRLEVDVAAPPREHGLPAAEPVPDERVRQRGLRAARAGRRRPRRERAAAAGRGRAPACRPLGRGRRDDSRIPRCGCRAASSSGSASRARWRRGPRCCCWTSRAPRSTRARRR